jgi:hypothetical protein
VVWQGYDGDYEIFLYEAASGTTTPLTSNSSLDFNPQINASGDVVWNGHDGTDYEIFLYEAASGTTAPLTSDSVDDATPQINASGDVVWRGYDGTDNEIFLYEAASGTTTPLTTNSVEDFAPQINASGDVVWHGYDGTDWEIFLYEAASGTTTPLTSNSSQELDPQINASGDVVWRGSDGTDYEIFLHDTRRGCYTVAQTQASAYGVPVFDASLGTLEEVDLKTILAAGSTTTNGGHNHTHLFWLAADVTSTNGGHDHGISVPALSGNGLTIPATSWGTEWAGDHSHVIFFGGSVTSWDGDHAHAYGPRERTVHYGGPELPPFLGPSDFSINTGNLGLTAIADHSHSFAGGFQGTASANMGDHSISPTWTTQTTFFYRIFACGNGRDDDGDSTADYPGDSGCDDLTDDSERRLQSEGAPFLPCDDGDDNDGDGYIDFDPLTYANPGDESTDPAGLGDPVCTSPTFTRENSKCQDGLDNDGDGGMDYDGGRSIHGTAQTGVDLQCVGRPEKDKEKKSTCGLGFELVLLLPVLIGLHRRRRTLRV